MTEHLIGTSLSFCIQDMIEDKVKFSSVKCIISGTWIADEEDYEKLRDRYCEAYWTQYPVRARNLLRGLYDAGKIIQPRILGLGPLNINSGHWYELIK